MPRPPSAARRARTPAGDASDLLADLNPEQRAAVTAPAGPLLVLAGAGSGKTRVITVRIAWLLALGAPPESILAVTFTNKAAREMRERVAAQVGAERAGEITIGTFHAFCLRLLREHGRAIGLPANFTICDASDQLAAMRRVLRELRVAERTLAPAALQARISLAKSRLETPEALLSSARSNADRAAARAWRKYDEQLRAGRNVDFDDLLVLSVRLLREHEDVRAGLARRFRHVLVDEYQDTNQPQYELLRAIAGGHRAVTVVGDDDQSIYGWRGADVRKILRFEHDFAARRGTASDVTVVRLETNYRSTRPILEAANRVIRWNSGRHDKALRSEVGDGEPVVYRRVDDETAEAEQVARELGELRERGAAELGDFAVLFRAAAQARPFESALRARSIPYRLVGGMSFFDRKEVRDVVAYLKLAANPDDEPALLRVADRPPRGLGRASFEKALAAATARGVPLARLFDEGGDGLAAASVEAARRFLSTMRALGERDPGRDLVDWLRRLLAATNYRAEVDRSYDEPAAREERWQGVLELLDFAENHVRRAKRPTLAGFLDALALTEEESREDGAEGTVTLMTLHSAKGLEFTRVWLVGVEEGGLPHARAVAEGTIEEERRLMYVGITRARRHLTVSCVKSRARRGARGEVMPSRFVYEMRGEEPPKAWRAWEA